jgi:uncharacterized membrane protein
MKNIFTKKVIDRIFEIGLFGKFLIGVLEFSAGIIYWISGQVILNRFLIFLANQEAAEDPNDFVVNYFTKIAGALSVGTHVFAIAYLIFHGLINILLVIILFRDKLWAYHWAMVGFTTFVVYQIYRYFYTGSLLLLFLTAFDVFIILFILIEYRKKRKALLGT